VSPVALSVAVGVAATAIGLPLATAIGGWLARSRSRWRPVVTTIVFLPLVLPPVVTGWLLLALLGRQAPLGSLLARIGWPIPFSPAAAVIAAVVVGLPLFVMSARAAFEAVDRRYEEMSLTLGLTPAQTLWRVTLPLAAPGLAAGAVLSFARALGEFGATIVLAGNTDQTRTIAVAVYALLDDPSGDASIVPLVLASVGLSAAALAGFELLLRWQRRRLELVDG
jgi:molybdate transport system permease protein